MRFLSLLGDSVLDNGNYVDKGQSSTNWLQRFSPPGWRVLLYASDGAVLSSIPQQVKKVPPFSDTILLSVGGNDAMKEQWRLSTFKGKTLWRSLRVAASDFGLRYERMLHSLRGIPQKVVLSTIYGGDFGEDQNIIDAAITLYNQQILRLGRKEGWRVLDLFSFLRGKEFFVLSIEPSSFGSATLAHHFWKMIE